MRFYQPISIMVETSYLQFDDNWLTYNNRNVLPLFIGIIGSINLQVGVDVGYLTTSATS
jgi:hypothetical protein